MRPFAPLLLRKYDAFTTTEMLQQFEGNSTDLPSFAAAREVVARRAARAPAST